MFVYWLLQLYEHLALMDVLDCFVELEVGNWELPMFNLFVLFDSFLIIVHLIVFYFGSLL